LYIGSLTTVWRSGDCISYFILILTWSTTN